MGRDVNKSAASSLTAKGPAAKGPAARGPAAKGPVAKGAMLDRFGRAITYLRISVTDRCNLQCRYCATLADEAPLARKDLLSFEEITEVTEAAVALGVRKVRLTGGEPLMRRDVEALMWMLAALPGVEDFAMTTNGVLLADHAYALADAGLQRINVHLDTVNPQRYSSLTSGGDLGRVLAGIEAARAAGLAPIKLNCVVSEFSAESDAQEVADFAAQNGLEVRIIRRMNLATGDFWIVEGGAGGDCRRCDRLRLSCDGIVRPCLFSDLGFSVRELGAERALRQAVDEKPERGAPCPREGLAYRAGGIRGIGG